MPKTLIINVCKHKLHYFEFIKPIEDILKSQDIEYEVRSYKRLNKIFLEKYNKIILTGTSLKDSDYLNNLKKFSWIKTYKGAILGICAGMQILCLVYGCKLKPWLDIGLKHIMLKNFLGYDNWTEVYELHNYSVERDSVLETEFNIASQGSIDAIKHKNKPYYGVLFHPEVRQKTLIINFLSF